MVGEAVYNACDVFTRNAWSVRMMTGHSGLVVTCLHGARCPTVAFCYGNCVMLGIVWRLLPVIVSGFGRWGRTTTGHCWWAVAMIRRHASGSSALLSVRRSWENTTTFSSVLHGRPILLCSTLPRPPILTYVASLHYRYFVACYSLLRFTTTSVYWLFLLHLCQPVHPHWVFLLHLFQKKIFAVSGSAEENTKYWTQPVAWPYPFFIHHQILDEGYCSLYTGSPMLPSFSVPVV